jgi:hypothetical protein
MKNLFPLVIAIFFLGFLSSCTTTRSFPTMEGSYEGIEVYTAKTPEKNFNEIQFIEVTGSWPMGTKGLMNKMIERAKALGANGLVNVRFNTISNIQSISGTAVKFEEEVE